MEGNEMYISEVTEPVPEDPAAPGEEIEAPATSVPDLPPSAGDHEYEVISVEEFLQIFTEVYEDLKAKEDDEENEEEEVVEEEPEEVPEESPEDEVPEEIEEVPDNSLSDLAHLLSSTSFRVVGFNKALGYMETIEETVLHPVLTTSFEDYTVTEGLLLLLLLSAFVAACIKVIKEAFPWL